MWDILIILFYPLLGSIFSFPPPQLTWIIFKILSFSFYMGDKEERVLGPGEKLSQWHKVSALLLFIYFPSTLLQDAGWHVTCSHQQHWSPASSSHYSQHCRSILLILVLKISCALPLACNCNFSWLPQRHYLSTPPSDFSKVLGISTVCHPHVICIAGM